MIWPMVILGAACIFNGVMILIAFWLGYKAGIKEMPEMPSGKVDIEDITTSEEMDYEVSDQDYLKIAREFKEELIEREEPEHLE